MKDPKGVVLCVRIDITDSYDREGVNNKHTHQINGYVCSC